MTLDFETGNKTRILQNLKKFCWQKLYKWQGRRKEMEHSPSKPSKDTDAKDGG